MTVPARQRVLDALLQLIADRGLEDLSIRDVALQAGVSIGTVQYYCRTKDEMLRMAFEYTVSRILSRVKTIPTAGQVGAVLRAALLECLPLDDTRRVESRVYLAFAARAAVSPVSGRVQHGIIQEMRALCAEAFQQALDRREATRVFDPTQAAASTTALVDGLLLHLVTDPEGLAPEAAIDVLDSHLRQYVMLDDAPSVSPMRL